MSEGTKILYDKICSSRGMSWEAAAELAAFGASLASIINVDLLLIREKFRLAKLAIEASAEELQARMRDTFQATIAFEKLADELNALQSVVAESTPAKQNKPVKPIRMLRPMAMTWPQGRNRYAR